MKKYRVAIAIIIAGIVIAGAVYVAFRTDETGPDAIRASAMRPVGPTDAIIGNPLAPVMLVEYCVPDSAYCAAFEKTLRALVAEYGVGGNVALVMRNISENPSGDAPDANGDNLAAMGATSVPFTVIIIRGRDPLTVNGLVSYEELKAIVDHALSSTRDNR